MPERRWREIVGHVEVQVAGYTYKRRFLIRSYLRKSPRRRRRVRVNVYRIAPVKVPARVGRQPVYAWFHDVSDQEARREQLEAIRLGFAERPEALDRWLNVNEYQERIEVEMERQGYVIGDTEARIYHLDPAEDFINLRSLFVWPRPEHPRRIYLKQYGKDAGKKPFNRVRVWFWVRYDGDEEVQLWARSMSHPRADYEGVRRLALALWDVILKDVYYAPISPRSPGKYGTPEDWTPLKLVAWTAYLRPEVMPTNQKWRKT